MSTSVLQRHVGALLSEHFGHLTIRENTRPSWLLGPKGERLELDFFIEELHAAIEVQGRQHYEYTPHFHNDFSEFKTQLDRDVAKRETCDDYGIALFEVFDEASAADAIKALKRLRFRSKRYKRSVSQTLLIILLRLHRSLRWKDYPLIGQHAIELRKFIAQHPPEPLDDIDLPAIVETALCDSDQAIKDYRRLRKEDPYYKALHKAEVNRAKAWAKSKPLRQRRARR